MPDKPQWIHRIPEILDELRVIEAPFIDRSVLERAFLVSRRSAIYLMKDLGGYQIGKTLLVSRSELIRRLESLQAGEMWERESRRKVRLTEELARARKQMAARRVEIQVAPEALDRNFLDLPAGIRLEPGNLNIRFESAEDLLAKLFELSQAMVNDYARFESLVEHEGEPATGAGTR